MDRGGEREEEKERREGEERKRRGEERKRRREKKKKKRGYEKGVRCEGGEREKYREYAYVLETI